ncbi:MAG: BREX-1 system adenine-specific DNA-methyltransferase PglX [Collinsella sp.]|nr:BREX-1 system adenine-specific DNA-methyltransferase PglX [Collinsella sp.]MDY4863850.1 BREX-1 system adenine-specific DNA-methyltransferase PglX [Collinsella sp.]
MNDTAIKNYCIWARNELIAGVEARMRLYGVAEGAEPAGAAAVGGRALSPEETGWRDALLRAAAEEGFARLRDRAAYTWFNRIAAVRYMEVHDFLPSRVRMFTRPAADGSWELGSQAADEALDVEIEGADPVRIAELKQAGEDGPLFRYLFLAQCAELSGCLPGVFQPVDACMALLLPANLMDPDGVIGRMVGDIPEEDWENVLLLGWMYQYYNAERKAEVDAAVKKGAKVQTNDLAPKTQLFTPDWIVRYMVDNSLGRLWMLNNPQSHLREQMAYYIESDAEHEDFIHISGPEDITFCDPACGSAHILAYAFELLVQMYLERGYPEREIPELILTKNLYGMEIDPRAGQFASLVLAMCSREHDRRFFKRGVSANILTLKPVVFEEGDLPEGCALAKKRSLLDALAHLDEVGSLLVPDGADIAAISEAIELCGGLQSGLFAGNTQEKLKDALADCEALSSKFSCVVANPPYLGSSAFDPFMSKWIKKNYADVKSDLCTCFISRIFSLTEEAGLAGLATSNSWMFLSSYENLRQKLVATKTIDSLVQLSVHGFHGIAAQVCTFVIRNKHVAGYRGGYIRLNDFDHWSLQEGKTLEAIKNPDCGWFYRRDAETFKQIPGTPIAYWASDGLFDAFEAGPLAKKVPVKKGLDTGDNDRFLRYWHEVDFSKFGIGYDSAGSFLQSGSKWAPHDKGGDFRKWYGNNDWIINWGFDGMELKASSANLRSPQFYFQRAITWSALSSGRPGFRLSDQGALSNTAGSSMFPEEKDMSSVLAYMNSSVVLKALELLAPTLNYSAGPVGSVPLMPDNIDRCPEISDMCVSISKGDWDSSETSWNFKRHPLV